MRLREIEIRDFRKLRHASIKGLSDGANVIAGCNEAGKSTVLAALQTALFQRHNITGNLLKGLQPFGCSVNPEVNLVFELADRTYRLRKTFGGGGSASAELTCPDGNRFANHDADHQLEELLRFQGSSRGAAKFQELGIWPLFWVEQGTTFQSLSVNPDVRATVQSSLSKEVGNILVGESAGRLHTRIELAYKEYFTAKKGEPTGVLAAAEERVNQPRAELKKKRAELESFNSLIQGLESDLAKLAELEAPQMLPLLEKTLADAEEAARCAERILQQRQTVEQSLKLARIVLEQAADAVTLRQERVADLTRLKIALAQLHAQQIAAQEEFASVQGQFAKASEDLAQERATFVTANSSHNDVNRVREFLVLNQQNEGELKRLRDARSAEELAMVAEKSLAGMNRISETDMKQLRLLDAAASKAEAHLDAAATKLEFHFQDTEGIRFNGGPLPGENPVMLTDAAVIEIPRLGSLRVVPGGDTLAERRTELEKAKSSLALALSAAAAGSVADAEEALRLKQEAARTVKSQRDVLASLAPEGISVLQDAVNSLGGRMATLAENLDVTGVPDLTTAEIRTRATEADVRRLEIAVRGAENNLEQLRLRRDAARERLTDTQAEFRSSSAALEGAEESLKTERQKAEDIELEHKSKHAHDEERQLQATFVDADTQYNGTDPDAIAARVQMSKGALANLNSEIQRLEKVIERTRGALESIGKTGTGEQCAALEAVLNDAVLHQELLNRDAQAVRLLYNTIKDAARDANAQFLHPVVERVQPYLKQVLPGARVKLSTALAIEGLDRGDTTEPFDSLSVGAREQLSVLTRIAFADLLASEGVAAPIILDDALVYSDNARFSDMLLSLSRAAKRHQILILTCHEDRYLKMGAPIIHLEESFSSQVLNATG